MQNQSMMMMMMMVPLLLVLPLQLTSFGCCHAFTFPHVAHQHKHQTPQYNYDHHHPLSPARWHHQPWQRKPQRLQQQRLASNKNPDDSPTTTTTTTSSSSISDWVVENLESNGTQITSSSSCIQAGENDTLPIDGLLIGPMRILAANAPYNHTKHDDHDDDSNTTTTTTTTIRTQGTKEYPIRLLLGRNGWGTGVHPSTRLCIEWLCMDGVISRSTIQQQETEERQAKDHDNNNNNKNTSSTSSTSPPPPPPSMVVMDYGCGSGILSIAALHLGASSVIGVDIEAEALVTAERNVQLNGFVKNGDSSSSPTTTASSSSSTFFQPYHTREVLPYQFTHQNVSICVANILIGQLVRPSMIAALVTNIRNGGLLCFSGIRPWEVDALKAAYDLHVDEWLDDDYYAELSADDTMGSTESYGFNVGSWARVVGRVRNHNDDNNDTRREEDIRAMSELAVS